MAAPIMNFAAFSRAYRPLSACCFQPHPIQILPIRCKMSKSGKKMKAPHVPAEKAKWVPAGSVVEKKYSDDVKKLPMWQERNKVVDDVWWRGFHPRPQFTIKECIQRHQEFAQPAMLDSMDNLIYMDVLLNMKTKKKTKFMRTLRGTIRFPNEFDSGVVKRVIAFCKSEEDIQKAKERGAIISGGTDLIKMIENGELRQEEYDIAVATFDIAPELIPIRHAMRDILPNKAKGTISDNIEELVDLYVKGYTYASQKNEFEDENALVIPFGRLHMKPEELEDNAIYAITSLRKQKKDEPGPFIKQIFLNAPPSPEKFLVQKQHYQPASLFKEEQEDEDKEDAGSDEDEAATISR